MFKTMKKCWVVLSVQERRQGVLITFLLIVAAFLEVIGVGSVGPFLAILANPDAITDSQYLSTFYEVTKSESPRDFLFLLGAFTACILVGTAVFRAAVLYLTMRFTNMHRHRLSLRLLSGHLGQPYSFFIQRNSNELTKTILSETEIYLGDVLRPTAQVLSYGVLLAALLGFIVLLDPTIAFASICIVGAIYFVFWLSVRRWLSENSLIRTNTNTERYKFASEVLNGIKELRLTGADQIYLEAFENASNTYSRSLVVAQSISALPRYFVQGSAFAAIIGLALSLLARDYPIDKILPIVGMYAFAGYRLLPAVQNVYQGITQLRFGDASADVILNELKSLPRTSNVGKNITEKTLPLQKEIRLQDIVFRYHESERPALQIDNLVIKARARIGIIGTTGAGKSTLVDIILGLLYPEKGRVLIDDRPLTSEIEASWQKNIGYVPQQIFLADDTIERNISFGDMNTENIHVRVEKASRLAQLHEFVENSLPRGYRTMVGDRGVRLSGGQRQRIGIARSLYHDPEILIFDEATSALDMDTEAAVMDAVRTLSGEKTIIMIAHRMETLRNCDKIIKLENGKIKREGTYSELVKDKNTISGGTIKAVGENHEN